LTEEETRALELWEAYPNFKRPIIPTEFIDAFILRAKSLGLDTIKIDGELNPFNADFKCKVALITQREWASAPEKKKKKYDHYSAVFELSHMNGCGGILLSHSSYVYHGDRKKGFGSFMQEMKMWIASKLEVSMLLSTVVVGNEAEEGLLGKHGWQPLGQPFRNCHTECMVQMWQKTLT